MGNDQQKTIAFLSAPASYGGGVDAVARHDTHASVVFLAGDFAYKLKRAIKYPYLDYSTLERRKAMCERELAINRRTAPQLYLDVKPIVQDRRNALRFGGPNDEASAVDWVVVMRRFDQGCLFGSLCASGHLTVAVARALGDAVADFHLKAEPATDRGGAAQIAAVLDENASILGRSRAVSSAKAERLKREARAAFARVERLLDSRKKDGFVRRCHGDMHLDNICLLDGAPVLIDAIEFNEDFACIDVFYDLAFPLMELMRHGLRHHANALLNRYLERTADYEGLAALPLFLSCRAAIRAHIALARIKVEGESRHENDLREAQALLECALAHLAPRQPRLVAIGGVSGTGKSTLAYRLAPQLEPSPGAIVIRSDLTRKALAGVEPTARLPADSYTPAMHARVFAAMAERAATTLTSDYSAIVDGVYGEEDARRRIAALASHAGVAFDGLWLRASRDALRLRVAARRGDASDATVEVLHQQLMTVTTPADWIALDAGPSPVQVLDAARRSLAQAGHALTESAYNPI